MPEDSGSARPTETRKLAAIMFTDIAGFSRQMGADEARMLRLLEIHNRVIQQAVTEHHGTVIKTVGDAFLVDFPSVVHAVQCAQQIQAQFRAHNVEKEKNEQIHIRVGVHLGDIVVQPNGDVLGDGVNIASRLQTLAEPDTICISDMVYRDVAQKIPLGTVISLGRPKLKNIAQRFPVYALLSESPKGFRQTLNIQRWKLTQKKRAWQVAAAVLAVGVGSAGTLVIKTRYFPSAPQSLPPASAATGTPALPLPDKPSIVVLPFVNMSEDSKQEYFSDGLTEDLTSDLSKLSGLFIIARNSAFTYKGKAVKVQDVSKELGVRYVLEGSVRKADDQVRITAQLIDATTGSHQWAERYDRPLKDIFALQDEIVQKIVANLRVEVFEAERERARRIPTDNLTAYDYFLRGVEYFFHTTKEDNLQARRMCEKAVALDPQYAEAYAWMGFTYYLEWLWGWSRDAQTLEQALAMAQRAVALDDSLPGPHGLLGMIYALKKQYDQAIEEGERAIALDPNNADGYGLQAEALNLMGRPEEALRAVQQAMRLNPHATGGYLINLGLAYYLMGRYTDAISTIKNLLVHNPNWLSAYPLLSSSYVQQWMSQQSQDPQTLAQALAAAQRAVTLNPSYWQAHLALGAAYLGQRQYEQAITEMKQALALDPNDAGGYQALAVTLAWMGRPEEALQMAEQTLHRKPIVADLHLSSVGVAYDLAGRPEEAIAPLKQYLTRYPNILGAHLTLAAVYSELGREAEARAEAAEVLRINPNFSLEIHRQRVPIKDPAVLERHLAALRKAGLK